eukprot:scaffold186535_cov41-Tisochrysis_lutea.AAC.1
MRSHIHRRPRLAFDSTFGYPGEAPICVAIYNTNGTKGGKLAAVLSQARKAGSWSRHTHTHTPPRPRATCI